MEHFVAIAGWVLAAIFFLGAIFFYGCSRCEKKDKDSTWKISCSLSLFLFLAATYCAVSAYMVG
jgi:hypothetical protein